MSNPPDVPLHDVEGRMPIVVLLVDDQRFVSAAVGLMLKSEPDIDLHWCGWAVNAVALADQLDPSLVLQDLQMPEIDGLTLVRAFRANPRTAGTPIVVLSGSDDADNRARALEAGAHDYLVKLPGKAELIACVRRHAARSAGGTATLDVRVIDGFCDVGDPAFARGLIDQFLEEADVCVRSLDDAAGRLDVRQLNATAHKLKGSSSIMGASRLAALCGQVEDQASGSSTGEGSAALVGEIDRELRRVTMELTTRSGGMGR